MPRAKIGLNCHYYGGSPILEIHRIMQMLSHYTLVMSVRSDDKLLDEMFEPFVTFFDDEMFNQMIKSQISFNTLITIDTYLGLIEISNFYPLWRWKKSTIASKMKPFLDQI